MNICTKCMHHVSFFVFIQEIHGCDRDRIVDPVDGKPLYKRCSTEREPVAENEEPRAADKRCGIEGKFFDAGGMPA